MRSSHNIVHYSLEPSKIMCGWDGTTKILGYGVSSVGKFVQHVPEAVPSILHYMSPEQVRGEATDAPVESVQPGRDASMRW